MKVLLHLISACIILVTGTNAFAQSKEETLGRIEKLFNNKMYNEALMLLDPLMKEYPDYKLLIIQKASLIDQRGDRLECLKILMNARDRFPESDTIIGQLGYMYRYSGLLDSAMSCYNKCLTLVKSSEDSLQQLINIGSLYLDRQEYAQAIRFYENLHKKYPKSAEIEINLSQAYAYDKQNEKALLLMKKLVQEHPSIESINNIGLHLTEMGRYEEAYTYFKNGVNDYNKNDFMLNNFGYLLYKMKDYNKALIQINKSININSSNPYAYRNRALVFIGMKMMNEACKDLHASEELGFKIYYGSEVEELIATHCAAKK